MTSKTFKSAGNPEAAISVVPSADGVRTVHVHGIEASGVTVPCEDAPALALAILEAAGAHKDSQDFLGGAVEQLKFHIGEQERATAEARERAELEAEALELFNVVREHDGEPKVATWDGFHAGTMEVYLLLARRARELAKEATK